MKPFENRGLKAALVALLVLSFARAASAQSLVRGPYLQSGTPDSMVVRWRTSSPSDSWLSYGPAPGQLTTTISLPASLTEHEIQIDGLEPDTAY